MNINDFLNCSYPILDVRSPGEFLQGHIPGAFSFPLFSDSERAQVGTIYKKEGKDAAVKLGLHFVGPKLALFVENAEKISGPAKTLRLYCARGGMRSSSLAWLLQTAGFHCILLKRGYKAFRQWSLSQFDKSLSFVVLGGLTGSGKTELLQELKIHGEQVIDLEGIARHRGSSFGHMGLSFQPSCEHFENTLAWELAQCHSEKPIWIEDESRSIGKCYIPQGLWKQMSAAPFLWIQSPREKRVKKLLSIYGNYSTEEIIEATQRLVKKLGAVKTKEIIQNIQNGEMEVAVSNILDYYDRAYTNSCQKNNRASTEYTHSGSIQELIDAGNRLRPAILQFE